jgi:bifunctional oligoribonuclease and PAP phosphatase NrnA
VAFQLLSFSTQAQFLNVLIYLITKGFDMPTITDRIWSVRSSEIVRHLILCAERIVITGHSNPDGDSIGALLSLGLGLQSINKDICMICQDQIPQKYRHLPGVPQILNTSSLDFDLAIAVDCGSKEMIGPAYELFEKADRVLEIDHHRSRIPFGDVSFVDPDASSAGELVYELLLDLEIPITTELAQNILTSIVVETNSFRLPGIRPHTFELCAELLRTGVNFHSLAETVYWATSRETAILSGICLSRCQFSFDGQLAWSIIRNSDLKRASATDADADPITEKIRSIQGVKVAILIREKTSKLLRISFRSKDGINVASIAEKFGGGGHLSAAGCTIANKNYLIKELLDYTKTVLKNYSIKNRSSKHSSSQELTLEMTQNNDRTDLAPINAVHIFEPANDISMTEQSWNKNTIDLSYLEKQYQSKVAF